jgi:hypothetical protein
MAWCLVKHRETLPLPFTFSSHLRLVLASALFLSGFPT